MLYMWGCGLRVVYAYSQQLRLFLLYLLKATCIKTCPIITETFDQAKIEDGRSSGINASR
jgi:hypothetical protein